MELKWAPFIERVKAYLCSNRTFMELKCKLVKI